MNGWGGKVIENMKQFLEINPATRSIKLIPSQAAGADEYHINRDEVSGNLPVYHKILEDNPDIKNHQFWRLLGYIYSN